MEAKCLVMDNTEERKQTHKAYLTLTIFPMFSYQTVTCRLYYLHAATVALTKHGKHQHSL